MAVKRKERTWDVQARDVPRDRFPTGRVKIRLGAVGADDAKKRRAALEQLRAWNAWDVVAAVIDGRLPLSRVAASVRERGDASLQDLRDALLAAEIGVLPTVREAADQYLAWYAREKRALSHRGRVSQLKRFCEQKRGGGTMGDCRIDQLSTNDIEAALHAVDVAPASQEAMRLAVSGLFTWWRKREAENARIDARPARTIDNPASKVARRERGKRVTTATDAQMVALFAAGEVYQQAYLRALAHLGLREAELVHTRLHTDLDVNEWVWRIQPRGSDGACGCPDCSGAGWRPKSKLSHRILSVPSDPPQLRAAILRYLDLYPCQPGDFVFRNPRTDRVWSARRFDRDFETLCERAGVRHGSRTAGGLTPHIIRHTCATALLRSGVDSAVVAALLGDTLKTIAETYLHITTDDLAAAVRRGPRYDV